MNDGRVMRERILQRGEDRLFAAAYRRGRELMAKVGVEPVCDPSSPGTHCGASDCTDHGRQEA